MGRVGIVLTAASFLLSLVLTWSSLITGGLLWRLWFLTTESALAIAHVLLVLRSRRTPVVLLVRNVTLAGVAAFAALALGMTFRADFSSMRSREARAR